MFNRSYVVNNYYMKRFNFFKTFDAFFRILIIFLACFVWCRYFIDNLWISLVATIFLTIIIDLTINFVKNKRQKKKNTYKEEDEKIQQYINTFIFSEDNFSVNFFYELAKIKHQAQKKNKYIEVVNTNKKIILFPYFIYRDFNSDDLVLVYNKTKKEMSSRLIICTNTIDNNAIKLAQKLPLDVYILDGNQVYEKLLKKYNYFPYLTKLKSETKIGFKEILSYALNKKRTKGYFIASVILLLSSFFVPYKIYYVVMATLLLILSLVSFSNPKYNKIENIELLDLN